jgi:predicted permease
VAPFSGSWSTGSFTVEGYQPPQGQPGPWGDIRIVDAGFHDAMKIQLIKGRHFEDRDDLRAPQVAIVDEGMVRRFWADGDPIGKRITFGDPQSPDVRWITVVGVVAHTKHEGLDAENRVQLYLPLRQRNNVGGMAFVIRTSGEPRSLLPAITAAVQGVDRDIPVANVNTMDDMISSSKGQRRFAMLLLGLFATLALALASIGIYGVMSYAVTQRSHELGVRMTLGATRANVLALVMRSGMSLIVLGAVIGVAGAFALRGVIARQLFGVSANDPITLALTVVTLTAVAALATLVPALRATRVDPAVAMREE